MLLQAHQLGLHVQEVPAAVQRVADVEVPARQAGGARKVTEVAAVRSATWKCRSAVLMSRSPGRSATRSARCRGRPAAADRPGRSCGSSLAGWCPAGRPGAEADAQLGVLQHHGLPGPSAAGWKMPTALRPGHPGCRPCCRCRRKGVRRQQCRRFREHMPPFFLRQHRRLAPLEACPLLLGLTPAQDGSADDRGGKDRRCRSVPDEFAGGRQARAFRKSR